jgi:hypothetical protein
MKRNVICSIYFCLSPLLCYSNWTNDESNKSIQKLGVHIPTTGYVVFNEGVDSRCLYQHLYFDVSSTLGKTLYATLLVARASSEKVRVGYTPPSSGVGICSLVLVQPQ